MTMIKYDKGICGGKGFRAVEKLFYVLLLLCANSALGQSRSVIGNTTTIGLSTSRVYAGRGTSSEVSSFARYSNGVDRINYQYRSSLNPMAVSIRGIRPSVSGPLPHDDYRLSLLQPFRMRFTNGLALQSERSPILSSSQRNLGLSAGPLFDIGAMPMMNLPSRTSQFTRSPGSLGSYRGISAFQSSSADYHVFQRLRMSSYSSFSLFHESDDADRSLTRNRSFLHVGLSDKIRQSQSDSHNK